MTGTRHIQRIKPALYMAWADRKSGRICLSMSRDRAETWSAPMLIRTPGTAFTAKVSISVRGPGDIALAYWGSAQSYPTGDGWVLRDGRPYHGYLTICRDLNAASPVFWTAAVNDKAAPLLPKGESALTSGEYIGPPSFGADGSVWAAYLSLNRIRSGVLARLTSL